MEKVDTTSLTAYAKLFLNAKPTLKTKHFKSSKLDCSSFTQHVFTKHGLMLPLTVKAQATCGVQVDKAGLQKGDLLFFYVPERFETNDVPGHVGIYIGGRQMIPACPLRDGCWFRTSRRNTSRRRSCLRGEYC
jgi:cell wall-associated NlpC family hydrolase